MPPKKRKAGPVITNASRGKRVRIGSSSVIGEDDGVSVISASGRPKRSTAGEPSYDQTRRHSRTTAKPEPKSKAASTSAQPKKRGPGRPRKSTTPAPTPPAVSNATTGKKVERPKRASHVEVPARKRGGPRKEESSVPSSNSAAKQTPVKKATSKRANVQELAEDSTGAVVQDAEWEDSEPEETQEGEERQFWLMKAEPEPRMEKGVDVSFSIDDLRSKTKPEGWEGIRNPVARNNMRAMREGDLAFFYHSNCSIPGIAGIMQIVREHSIDESAFDPNHPYYDPKSTDRNKPKWELVHVKFMHKFVNLITLKELKAHMGPGEPLQHLQTLKQSRLSVSSVSPKEWNFIMDLSGEEFDEDQQPQHVEEGTLLDDETDTLTAHVNGDGKADAEDGAGAFDTDTDV